MSNFSLYGTLIQDKSIFINNINNVKNTKVKMAIVAIINSIHSISPLKAKLLKKSNYTIYLYIETNDSNYTFSLHSSESMNNIYKIKVISCPESDREEYEKRISIIMDNLMI